MLTDPAERAEAWAEIDKLVTEQAPAVPYQWEKEPMLQSSDVNGVVNEFYGAVGPLVHVAEVGS